MPQDTSIIAVLGLGEAGGAIATDLVAAGAQVRGFDPRVAAGEGIMPAADEAEAVAGAGLVLSVNSSADSVAAMRAGIPAAGVDTVWADLNTASPGKKHTLRDIATAAGLTFADVAIMAPVPGHGLRVPMLTSGAGAQATARALGELGGHIEVLDGDAGLAASRKLLRSVFFKGMSAAVCEALAAAQAAGCADWLRDIIETEMTTAGADTVERMVTGMRQHAVRREAEMAAASEMLTELDVPADIAAASRQLLERLAQQRD